MRCERDKPTENGDSASSDSELLRCLAQDLRTEVAEENRKPEKGCALPSDPWCIHAIEDTRSLGANANTQ